MADPTVGDAIDAAASQYGLDPAVLKGIAHIESSWDPGSNRNKSTQYKGLFQLGKEEWKNNGSGDIYDAQDNANAAGRLLSGHSQWFQNNYGRAPTPGELYMMHQQGRGFISNGTMTNIAGNPYPGMKGPQTPESFQKGWADTLDRRMAMYGGAGTAPTAVAGGPAPQSGGPVPAPQPGGWGPLTNIMTKLGLSQQPTGAVSGNVALAPPAPGGLPQAGPTPTGATLDAQTATVNAAQKAIDREKELEGEKQGKQMMALAQQLMAAGQAPKPNFMQLTPINTGPVRPLPLNLPPGFGSA